jgi:cytochrome c-type biogenesis protein CcmE
MKAKNQRLILAVLALFALIGAGLLAASALRQEASYFYTPTSLLQAKLPAGQALRLGGMVKRGSIDRQKDGVNIKFIVQDRDNQIGVHYRGITPDLFVEGSGVVADGKLGANGVFMADSLLAKHDENYKPRELQDIDMEAAQHSKDSLAP